MEGSFIRLVKIADIFKYPRLKIQGNDAVFRKILLVR